MAASSGAYGASNAIGILWSAAMFAWFFLSALYLQRVLGRSAMQVGLAFLPSNIVMAACSHPEQFTRKPEFRLRLKREFEPPLYWIAVAAMVLGGVVLPYGNELWRCLRARKQPRYNTGFYKDGSPRMPPEPEPQLRNT